MPVLRFEYIYTLKYLHPYKEQSLPVCPPTHATQRNTIYIVLRFFFIWYTRIGYESKLL